MNCTSQIPKRIVRVAPIGLALLFVLVGSQAALAQQWTTNGNDISNTNTGNVGIGTASPGSKLDVNGSVNATGNFQSFNGSSTSISFRDGDEVYRAHSFWVANTNADGGKYGGMTNYPGANTSVVNDGIFFVPPYTNNWNQWVPTLSIRGTSPNAPGNVGIGTTSPGSKLEINLAGTEGSGLNVLSGASNKYALIQWGRTSAEGMLAISRSAGAFFTNSVPGDAWFGSANGTIAFGDQTAGTASLIVKSGKVGIGTTNPQVALDVVGSINVSGNINAKYQDLAEWVPSAEQLAAGTVVVLDTTKSNQVISSSQTYDTRVAGVISAQPGITLGEGGAGKVLVATTGRVRVKVDASRGPIQIGDLLVTSDVPGVAMKSEPVELAGRKMHMPGTIIGKALEPLEKGKGEILVLLSLQ